MPGSGSKSVLVAAAPGAPAQTAPPATPTTKMLAIGTFAPGTDMQLVQRTLGAEVRATAELYLEGKIDQVIFAAIEAAAPVIKSARGSRLTPAIMSNWDQGLGLTGRNDGK